MTRFIRTILILSGIIGSMSYGQTAAPDSKPRNTVSAKQTPAQSPPAVKSQAEQRPWYEELFARINPDDLDYGTWLEQRRRAFHDAKIGNSYFQYSLWLTVVLFGVAGICVKLWIDKRRVVLITAGMMADLYNQDLLSKKAAEEAIHKYNEHIEACNRAFAMDGADPHSIGFASPTLEGELKRVSEELQRATGEVARLTQENETKARTLAGLSLRLEGISAAEESGKVPPSVDLSNADGKLIQHINLLQERLYVKDKDNKKLRGA